MPRIDELAMWWRQNDQEERRQRDVEKNWHLVQNHRREDPERHVAEEMLGDETDTLSDSLPLVEKEMLVLQEEILDWMELGMVSWFNFYFAIGPGTMDDRLSEASAGLGKASDRLDAVSAQMKYLPVKDSAWERPAQTYREAVADWAKSLQSISRSAQLDFKSLAREGFALMNAASATAEAVVDIQSGSHSGVDIGSRLETLRSLRPAKRVPRRAVEEAKAPWRRAIVAAGSKIDWPPNTT
jgi:hypothetical protein